jgi:hypothetical protein
MTVNSTPTGYIAQSTRVSARNFKMIAGLQVLDPVLSLDDWHGTQ